MCSLKTQKKSVTDGKRLRNGAPRRLFVPKAHQIAVTWRKDFVSCTFASSNLICLIKLKKRLGNRAGVTAMQTARNTLV
jgi:hypothetical protein